MKMYFSYNEGVVTGFNPNRDHIIDRFAKDYPEIIYFEAEISTDF